MIDDYDDNGDTPLTAFATPLIKPPPDMGTTTTSASGTLHMTSMPRVPWPAMMSLRLYGGTKAAPVTACISAHTRSRDTRFGVQYMRRMLHKGAGGRA